MTSRPWTVFALPGAAVIAFMGVFLFGGLDAGELPVVAVSAFVAALLVYGVWSARTPAWVLAIVVAGVFSVAALFSLIDRFSVASLFVLIGSADALILLNLPPTRAWVGSEAGGKTI